MNEERPSNALFLFWPAWWLAVVAVIFVAAFVFYSATFGHDEGVYPLDSEIRAIMGGISLYKAEFGAFPSGDSLAICQALTGNNPKGTRFLDLRKVNAHGDFLDPRGTPYKIYYSGGVPLLWSAGPNKQFDSSAMRKRTDDYFGG